MFMLSKQNLKLSEAEAVNLLKLKSPKMDENVLVADANLPDLFQRLAYTKKVLLYLFDCKVSELAKQMKTFGWQNVYSKNFCLRIFGTEKFTEKDLAGYIWDRVKKPKVNLEHPATQFELHFLNDKVYCGKLLWENNEDFNARRAHLRSELMPTSLHPRLARCFVNLTGCKGKETIIDPFCGTGGILIEAGMMKLNVSGSDIDPIIVRKCLENLKPFKLKVPVKVQDALKIKRKSDYVVTDLPYGKNTGKLDLEKLYTGFLKTLKKTAKDRSVIVFPDSVNYKKLVKTAKLKIESKFSYYIHKSMTKKIVVLH